MLESGFIGGKKCTMWHELKISLLPTPSPFPLGEGGEISEIGGFAEQHPQFRLISQPI